ncbi:MAG: winged helix-turn-helix transcriptional regulator [candidate division NC10 bacterium]|nr:winged helix-turn-helix transcriptional regulator [candidate division NC10 bacterium]
MRKTDTDKEVLQACEAHLRALQPVKKVKSTYRVVHRDRPELDVRLDLDTDIGRLTYFYEIKRGLSLPRLEHLILQLQRDSREAKARPLLLADYIPPRLAQRLVEAGVNFVDEAGNVYIDSPGKLYILIQGARPKRLPESKIGRLSQPSGLQVVFVLLAEPRAVSMSYRELAKASGVALGSVAQVMRELKKKGYLEQKGHDEWILTRKRELFDFWLGGYGDILRPKLVVGRFQPPERDLDQTLAKLQKESEAAGISFAVTGGFAADLLTHHFRGDQLGFFVSDWPAELTKRLRWLPSQQGPVTVLRQFSHLIGFTSNEQVDFPVAHPLLVYAELVFQGRERELEAAKLLYNRYLTSLLHAH